MFFIDDLLLSFSPFFSEIQGCGGDGEDRGGKGRAARQKVFWRDGGDAGAQDEIGEGNERLISPAWRLEQRSSHPLVCV